MDRLPSMPWRGTWPNQVGPPIQDPETKRRFTIRYDTHPLEFFIPKINGCSAPSPRWIYTDNEEKAFVFIFTDGGTPNKGQPGVRASSEVVHNPIGMSRKIAFERSQEGFAPPSNRAELRAAIAVITMRWWLGEAFEGLVIGTESEYVVRGATEWAPRWQRNEWKTASGAPVKNQDLWKHLLVKIKDYEKIGFSVKFYQLERGWNTKADVLAQARAREIAFADEPTY